MTLDGKKVLITGADSGIGAAIAELFAQAGADVAILYHTDHEGAQRTAGKVQAHGRQAFVLQNDVMDSTAVAAAMDTVVRELGQVDILVNSAGKGMGGVPVVEMTDEKLDVILNTDLKGPFFFCREFAKHRLARGGQGRIVLISSVAGHLPTPESAPYGMAKAGVNSLIRSLSRELAPHKINVNGIAPGLIQTPMTQERLDDPQARAKAMENIPWHRPGQPEEIAHVALLLASDAGDYVTGQTWTIDGGLTMQWGGA